MKAIIYSKGFMFTLIILASSCGKEEYNKPARKLEISVDEARQWFETNIQLPTQQIINGPAKSETREPHWDFAKVVHYKNSDVVCVPLKFKEDKKYKKGSLSKLIISKDGNGKMKLQVLKAIGTLNYQKQVNYKIGFDDFNGIVFSQDWEGNFMEGEYYVSGKPAAKLEKVNRTNVSTSRISDLITILVEEHWIESMYVDGVLIGTTDLGSTFYYITVYTPDDLSNIYGTFYNWSGGGMSGGGSSSGCPYGPNCTNPIPFDSGEVTVDIDEVNPTDDGAINRLCGYYNFSTTGDGLTTEITYLGAKAIHSPSGQIRNAFWGAVCITFGSSSNVHDSESGSSILNTAWNAAMDDSQAWLNFQSSAPTDYEFSQCVLSKLRFYLQLYGGGYFALSTGPCQQGTSIYSQMARYCP